MTPAATAVLVICVCACVCSLVIASDSGESGKRSTDNKKLRNVIITSFGEIPYEPMEGFVQADVIPVDLEDELKNPTMDVALRTGILVEDPNESKGGANDTPKNYDDGTRKGKVYGEDLLRAFKEKYRYADRKKSRRGSLEFPDQFVSPAQPSFGLQYNQPRVPVPYTPPRTGGNGFNIDREYFGDLGEGWNLQDAEEILKGRNYNILTNSPRSFSNNLPIPGPREAPPPLLPPGLQFYPLPIPGPFNHPTFTPQLPPQVYPKTPITTGARRTESPRQEPTLQDRQDDFLSGHELKDFFRGPKVGSLPTNKNVYLSEADLRGA